MYFRFYLNKKTNRYSSDGGRENNDLMGNIVFFRVLSFIIVEKFLRKQR